MTRRQGLRSGSVLVAVVAAGAVVVGGLPAVAAGSGGDPSLPLGPAALRETRTTAAVAPGVTLTTIVRGHADPGAVWTVEVAIRSGPGSPDPDAPPAAISDRASAQATAADLRDAGLDPVVEQVTTPAVADAGGPLGFRVRVGAAATRAEADAIRAEVVRAGYGGSSIYTGWDGEADDTAGSTGPWRIQVLTIDPDRFTGSLAGSYGPDLERRETTSALARAAGAVAAVNAGFFVFDPAAGAPGDPAGTGVYGGELRSEPVAGRPVLTLSDDARHSAVRRLWWRGSVTGADGATLRLDGLNRVPGLIRNCGGSADDQPTAQPRHDVTCTDPDEVVAFDGSYGAATPTGAGTEVVLDRQGRVTEVRTARGGAVPAGGRTVQATGTAADRLRGIAEPGQVLTVRARLLDTDGHPVALTPRTTVLNGGPELVRDGEPYATPARDGMAHSPSFYYGWVHKRHPRTLAGVDGQGRTVLVTADGRSLESMGLSISEAAAVAGALGLRDALNLDGGGSTTMVVDGRVVNRPSDAAGERPVGDAVLVLPG